MIMRAAADGASRCHRCLSAAVWWRGFAATRGVPAGKRRAARRYPRPHARRRCRGGAAADLRLTRVADYADLWVSLTRSDRWMAKHLRVDAPTTLAAPALFVTFHYGGGWWLTRYLRTLVCRYRLSCSAAPMLPTGRSESCSGLAPCGMKTIERVCGAPLIYTDWGHGTWRAGERPGKMANSVLALIDLPPPLVDRSAAVQFRRDRVFPAESDRAGPSPAAADPCVYRAVES